eukprot:gene32024-41531_t
MIREDYFKYKRAQHQEDLYAYENYFYGMKNGMILESGAFDGYNLSSTFMLEKFAAWNSIHVEADPINYKQLAINRPDSINVHMALCDTPRTLHYVDTGITLAHGIAEFMPEKFLRMHHPYLYRNRTRIGDLREVPCFPVQHLLRYLKVTALDIWVLDTEGAELVVLRGMDFAAVTVKVIIMECDEHELSVNKQKVDFLHARGYLCEQIHVTCYCRHASATFSRSPNLPQSGVRRNRKEMKQSNLLPPQSEPAVDEAAIKQRLKREAIKQRRQKLRQQARLPMAYRNESLE